VVLLNISSVRWKVERAEVLLAGLDKEVKAWHKTKPYGFTTEINEEFTRASVIVKVNSHPPIVRWSLILSDIFHNLRSALDQLIWAVAAHESPTGIPLFEKITFPIWDDPPSSRQLQRIETLSLRMRTVIESVQPYTRPYPGLACHPLRMLREIDNTNKRQLLMLATETAAQGWVRLTSDDVQDYPETVIHRGEIKDGTEVVTTTFQHPHPKMKYEGVKVSAIIAIMYPEPDAQGKDRDDYAVLLEVVVRVVNTIIDTVAAAAI
jgi:hypothetical protein